MFQALRRIWFHELLFRSRCARDASEMRARRARRSRGARCKRGVSEMCKRYARDNERDARDMPERYAWSVYGRCEALSSMRTSRQAHA
eukprot:3027565-Pleurochrysis_carterae.AAC.1